MSEHFFFHEVEWPDTLPGGEANKQHIIKKALKLAGGMENLWEHYYIGDSIGNRLERIDPGDFFCLFWVNEDNIKFTWPSDEEQGYHADSVVMQRAFELAGFPFLSIEDYFISDQPGEISLQWRSPDGMLKPGKTYYLRTIVGEF